MSTAKCVVNIVFLGEVSSNSFGWVSLEAFWLSTAEAFGIKGDGTGDVASKVIKPVEFTGSGNKLTRCFGSNLFRSASEILFNYLLFNYLANGKQSRIINKILIFQYFEFSIIFGVFFFCRRRGSSIFSIIQIDGLLWPISLWEHRTKILRQKHDHLSAKHMLSCSELRVGMPRFAFHGFSCTSQINYVHYMPLN